MGSGRCRRPRRPEEKKPRRPEEKKPRRPEEKKPRRPEEKKPRRRQKREEDRAVLIPLNPTSPACFAYGPGPISGASPVFLFFVSFPVYLFEI
jgi:hypothetical protein